MTEDKIKNLISSPGHFAFRTLALMAKPVVDDDACRFRRDKVDEDIVVDVSVVGVGERDEVREERDEETGERAM